MFYDGGSRSSPPPPEPRRSVKAERAVIVSLILIGFALLVLPISAETLIDAVRWMTH